MITHLMTYMIVLSVIIRQTLNMYRIFKVLKDPVHFGGIRTIFYINIANFYSILFKALTLSSLKKNKRISIEFIILQNMLR